MDKHCESIRETMTAFVVGELDTELHAEVEAHCTGCSACRAELEALRAVSLRLEKEFTADANPLELSTERYAQLLEAVRAKAGSQTSDMESEQGVVGRRYSSGRTPKRATWSRWVTPLATAAILILVFSFTLRTDRNSYDQIASLPKMTSSVSQEPSPHLQDHPAIDPESFSTYGLIFPVERDLDAERVSLIRVAKTQRFFLNYDYPPAYGLMFELDDFERRMPYFGLDGPTPYFQSTDVPLLAM